MRIYLDHNATSPLRPSVKEALMTRLGAPLNPSSVHQEGRQGRKVIEAAREKVAALVGADPKAVVFTSGGTEANNMALSPRIQFGSEVRLFNTLFVSAVEHPCVLAGGRFSKEQMHFLPVDENGIVDLEKAASLLADVEAPFVSVMLANNETGVIQPVAEAAAMMRAAGGLTHCDAVQALGKIKVNAMLLGVDYLVLSAHKCGGPMGVGAVWMRRGAPLKPVFLGGGQERSLRSGTENLAGISGFGAAAAASVAALTDMEALAPLRDAMEKLLQLEAGVTVFGENAPRLPNTSCFGLEGFRAETQVMAMDLADVCISAGSACSSGKVKTSGVLAAMGVSDALASCAIRTSFGWNSAPDDFEAVADAWLNVAMRRKAG